MKDQNQIPHRKSLKEILPKSSSTKRKSEINTPTAENTNFSEDNTSSEPILDNRKSRRVPKKLIYGILLILVVFIGIAASSFFSSVEATVIPRRAKVVVDTVVEAVPSGSNSQLEFGTASKEIKETISIPSTGEEEVNEKASGDITIFNDFSEEDQILVDQTRFETPDGKIYRIQEAITVPGQTTEGGETVPGQITVEVVADEAGEEYNLEEGSFTIPGFEGRPQFDGFYARVASPITGGFVGVRKVATEEDLEEAKNNLRETLENKATNLEDLQIPDTHIALEESTISNIKFSQKGGGGDEVIVEGTLELTIMLFDKKDLASFLANRYIPDYEDEDVFINNYDNIEISLTDAESLDLSNPIEVDIQGTALIVWTVDENDLKESLAGSSKSNYQNAIADFPSIENIQLDFMPPWSGTIPTDTEKIEITQIISE